MADAPKKQELMLTMTGFYDLAMPLWSLFIALIFVFRLVLEPLDYDGSTLDMIIDTAAPTNRKSGGSGNSGNVENNMNAGQRRK